MKPTHVARPGVEEDDRSLGNEHLAVRHIANRGPGKSQAKNSVISQRLADQRHDVAALLVILRVAHWLLRAVELADSRNGLLLDIGSLGQHCHEPGNLSRDGVESAREHRETDGGQLRVVELCVLVHDDVGLDAGLVRFVGHALVEAPVQVGQIDVASAPHLARLGRVHVDRVETEKGDVVLKVAGGGAEAADFLLDVGDLLKETVLLTAHAHAPVESQSKRERQALNHRHGVNGCLAGLPVFIQLLDEVFGFDIEVGDIGSDGGTVQSGRCTFATALERVAVGRCSNGGSGCV